MKKSRYTEGQVKRRITMEDGQQQAFTRKQNLSGALGQRRLHFITTNEAIHIE